MSDGGPGFVDVLHAGLGGELLGVTVRGPFGEPVPASVLRVGDTAYVETAQACGRHLLGDGDAERASTYGVGELVLAAADAGAAHVVVGLGGSGTNDGGAGLLAALGASGDAPLDAGPGPLPDLTTLDLAPARALLAGTRVTAASDVDNPLTGLFGATRTYGPQKGIAEERLVAVDAALEHLAGLADRRIALEKGAGAAGGLGYALLLLGADRVPGIGLVADAVDLPARAARADVVVTGEGAFDFSSRSGKVPYGVAEVAAAALRPCVALAGQVLVGSREMRALGVESAYSLVDLVGEERAWADPAGALADLAERVARTWGR
jgi:glycerate kinase